MKTYEEAVSALSSAMDIFEGMNFGPKSEREILNTVKRFAVEIGSMAWSVEDLKAACKRVIHSQDDYPSAKQFGEALQWAIDRRRQMEVSKYILCIDQDGTTMYADPKRVMNGVLLPSGDFSGNGLSLADSAKALPVSDECETVPKDRRIQVRRLK